MSARLIVRPAVLMVAILLVATGMRFVALFDSPPGWRDDELILFDIDMRIRNGWRPLYINEAEGHEPVYHYLHAATISLFGENIIGYKWLAMAAGTLTVALTFALARRMFELKVALVAAALMAVSFWPIMYARIGMRHIGLLPWMLGLYWILFRLIDSRRRTAQRVSTWTILGGICLAAALMTYFAGRVLPFVVVTFSLYLLLFHRESFKRTAFANGIVLVVGLAIATPMFIEVSQLPAGEERIAVVGPQLIELSKGNLKPAIDTTLDTLGMFTFKGDPEALYNVEGRPVFDWVTGAFFYVGLAIALWRWKRVEYAFVLIALGLGLAPAFVSNPPASFGHTIMAMPFVYILTALGMVRILKTSIVPSRVAYAAVIVLIGFNAVLSVHNYFGVWARDDYVRFLYHAPMREVAQWLEDTPAIDDVAISTHPNYLGLEQLALRLDLKRENVHARWFDAEQTVVSARDGEWLIATSLWGSGERVSAWLKNRSIFYKTPNFTVYETPSELFDPEIDFEESGAFNDQLDLIGVNLDVSNMIDVDLLWRVEAQGTSPALRTFVHLLDASGSVVSQFDGMGVYLPSLFAGDHFAQFVRLEYPDQEAGQRYTIHIGLYNSLTESRLRLQDGREFLTLEVQR